MGFRGGLVFKAHRLVRHSILGLRVIKKKKVWGLPFPRAGTPLGGSGRSTRLFWRVDRLRVGWLNGFSGRGAARAEDAQETPTQSHISPSILVYED